MAREPGSIIGDRYVLAHPIDDGDPIERWEAVDGVLRRSVILAFAGGRGDDPDMGTLQDDVVLLKGAETVLDGGFHEHDLYVVTPVDPDDDIEAVNWPKASAAADVGAAGGATFVVHGDATAPVAIEQFLGPDPTLAPALAGATIGLPPAPVPDRSGRGIARTGLVGAAAALLVAVALTTTVALTGDEPNIVGTPAAAESDPTGTAPSESPDDPAAEVTNSTVAPAPGAPSTTVRLVGQSAPTTTVPVTEETTIETVTAPTAPPTTVATTVTTRPSAPPTTAPATTPPTTESTTPPTIAAPPPAGAANE